MRYTLTVNESADLVMRDYQIVVSSTLQKRVVELAHQGHQGMAKKKEIDTNESVVSRDRRSGRRVGETMHTLPVELDPS